MHFVKGQNEMNRVEQEFWARYAEALLKRFVTGRNAEWHVRRAQEFCYGLQGRKLQELNKSDLDDYLEVIRKGSS